MICVSIDSVLSYQIEHACDFVFNIEVAKLDHQRLIREELAFDPPLAFDQFTQPLLQNRYLRVRGAPGTLKVTYKATVELDYDIHDPAQIEETPVAQLPMETIPFIFPSRYCQSDMLMRLARREFGALPQGYSRVTAICCWIRDNIEYLSGSTNASTSAYDTAVQRAGVCRDFAHLGVAFCRALNIPARFVTSYARFREPPADFHAVFEAYLDGRWYLFDPTELAPCASLARIGTGRDAAEVAFATIFGSAQMTHMSPNVGIISHAVEHDGAATAAG